MTNIITEKTKDEEIVKYVRNDNKEYFKYIVDRYESKILSYIKRLTYNSLESEDLTQQVFVNVYDNLDKFDTNSKFSSWLYRIAHNISINWLKKKKASISLDESEILAGKIKDKIDIEKDLIKKETNKSFTAVINKLPEKFKEPFILKYFENKSYEEISYILKIPKNTIGTFINRAKKLIKKECGDKDCNQCKHKECFTKNQK